MPSINRLLRTAGKFRIRLKAIRDIYTRYSSSLTRSPANGFNCSPSDKACDHHRSKNYCGADQLCDQARIAIGDRYG